MYPLEIKKKRFGPLEAEKKTFKGDSMDYIAQFRVMNLISSPI